MFEYGNRILIRHRLIVNCDNEYGKKRQYCNGDKYQDYRPYAFWVIRIIETARSRGMVICFDFHVNCIAVINVPPP